MTRFGLLSGVIHCGFAGLRISWRHWRRRAISQPSGKLADRLDGKPAQVIDRRDAPIDELSDAQLHLIASGGSSVPQKAKVLLIPPPAKVKD